MLFTYNGKKIKGTTQLNGGVDGTCKRGLSKWEKVICMYHFAFWDIKGDIIMNVL